MAAAAGGLESLAIRRYAARIAARVTHVGRSRRVVNAGGDMPHIIAEYSANLEDRPLKRQLEHAAKLLPDGYVLILGEDEVRQGIVTVKELSTSQQKKVLRSELAEALLQK